MQEKRKYVIQRNLYKNVPRGFIHPIMETGNTQVNINRRIGKQIVFVYTRMLLRNVKEQITNTAMQMNIIHCAKQEKPDTEEYVLNYFIYMKI